MGNLIKKLVYAQFPKEKENQRKKDKSILRPFPTHPSICFYIYNLCYVVIDMWRRRAFLKDESGIVFMTVIVIGMFLLVGYAIIRTIMEMLPMILLAAAILFGVIIFAKAYFTKTTGKMYDVPKEAEA